MKIVILAVSDKVEGSVTLSTKEFVPTSAESGVPDKLPSDPTLNQAGPLTLANVRRSEGFGSIALVETVPAKLWPAMEFGKENGLLTKYGAALT